MSHGKGYPTELHDCTGCLQARPIRAMQTRSADRRAQSTRVDGRSGVTAQARDTTTALCSVLQKELFANLNPPTPSEAGTEDVHLDAGSTRRTHSQRKSLAILPSACMVDSSPVVGHDALQRPSRPQAKRHSRDRQHDVRQVDEVKNNRR